MKYQWHIFIQIHLFTLKKIISYGRYIFKTYVYPSITLYCSEYPAVEAAEL